jgi:general secretion pathway protein J
MRDDGFTLMEVLVSLFIFAVLSAATLQAMTTAFRTRDGVDRSLERMEEVRTLDLLFRQDMKNIITRPTRDSFGTTEPVSLQAYAPDGSLLVFTRGGRSNPQGLAPRGDVMRVAYRLEGDELIRETPTLPTPAINTPFQRRVILSGVRSANITAYAQNRQLLQLALAPTSPDLPTRIELELETERGPITLISGVGQ